MCSKRCEVCAWEPDNIISKWCQSLSDELLSRVRRCYSRWCVVNRRGDFDFIASPRKTLQLATYSWSYSNLTLLCFTELYTCLLIMRKLILFQKCSNPSCFTRWRMNIYELIKHYQIFECGILMIRALYLCTHLLSLRIGNSIYRKINLDNSKWPIYFF